MYKSFITFSSFLQNLFRRKRTNIWEFILETMNTIEELCDYYIRENFGYSEERVENYKQPSVFVEMKVGDCDDYGKTNFEFMKRKGYTCWFVGIWKSKFEGHAIVVYIDKNTGLYNYVSNKKIVRGFSLFIDAVNDYYGYRTIRYEIIDKA